MEPDWDARYRDRSVADATAADVLLENLHLLPASGTALDLACGLGANAMLLAGEGLETFAWDSAATAVAKLEAWAKREQLPVRAEVRDVVASPPEAGRFDVITVCRFLERDLAPALIAALRPGGVLFYQTFTRSHVSGRGPSRDEFRLDDNELLRLFAPLQVLVYREEDRVGDLARGFRDEAQLVAQKRPA